MMAGPIRVADGTDPDLFDRIGVFLATNRLSPDPLHYAFAHRVLSEDAGPLTKAVAELTDGGVRLTRRDIEALGGRIGASAAPVAAAVAAAERPQPSIADTLVAQTQMQVEGFTDMVLAMRAETEVFGRDLAASADAIRDAHNSESIDEIMRMTGAMLTRVQTAETRLEIATREASELRTKLEEARDNARRDPLTDLPNRRAFEEAFNAQTLAGAPMCIGIVDVDHFKSVNDRFGHAVGDRVLKAIADALSKACVGHLVARYGGEEFAVLFTGDRDAALATLETAREAVAEKRYRLRETDAPLGSVTFSAGLTTAKTDEMLGTVFGRADRLLYVAKDAGRNVIKVG